MKNRENAMHKQKSNNKIQLNIGKLESSLKIERERDNKGKVDGHGRGINGR